MAGDSTDSPSAIDESDSARSPTPQESGRLLDPAVLAKFSNLELLARTVAEGVIVGLHRSPHFGFSQEFAEYRAYNEGDDLRFVDWNVYARTDRTFIKRYQGDTNTSLMLAIDTSASMSFGSDGTTKLDYARYLAATLAWLARRQHDAIGALFFADEVKKILPPSTRPDALPRLFAALERMQGESGTEINAALDSLQNISARRGLVAIISDFYASVEHIKSNLEALAHKGQDIALFHVIDVAERKPEFASVTALRDLESGQKMNVDPDYLAQRYRHKFTQHCDDLSTLSMRAGADYVQVDTEKPLDETLRRYLLFRQRKL